MFNFQNFFIRRTLNKRLNEIERRAGSKATAKAPKKDAQAETEGRIPSAEFTGSYRTWEDAASDSSRNDNENVMEKTVAATHMVASGKAVSCRDGVILDRIDYNWPLIATLLRTALERKSLSVADFGGGLGCTYFDCRHFLEGISTEIRWTIIELPQCIDAGRLQGLESRELQFRESIIECTQSPNVIIASGVLQYLPDPWTTLQELSQAGADYLFIDRTNFKVGPDRLTVQNVPEGIVKASNPCWFFSRERFDSWVKQSPYEMVAEFKALDWVELEGEQVSALGFILRRRLPNRASNPLENR
jgi:putative methyltransferase (TIGR04325 family)